MNTEVVLNTDWNGLNGENEDGLAGWPTHPARWRVGGTRCGKEEALSCGVLVFCIILQQILLLCAQERLESTIR